MGARSIICAYPSPNSMRCRYCMPEGMPSVPHDDILRYEELLRICRTAVQLGINRFKVTGGEPLVRRGCVRFICDLKAMPGAEERYADDERAAAGGTSSGACKGRDRRYQYQS